MGHHPATGLGLGNGYALIQTQPDLKKYPLPFSSMEVKQPEVFPEKVGCF